MKTVGVAEALVTNSSGVDEGPVVGVGVIVLVGVFVFSPIFVGVEEKVGVGIVGEAGGVRVSVKIETTVAVGTTDWGFRNPGRENTQAIDSRPRAEARKAR